MAEVRRRQLATSAHMEAWPSLVAQVRAQLAAGVSCEAEPMQLLARRWNQLFQESYCGKDAALKASVRQAFAAEPDLSLGVGVDQALMDYVRAAIGAMEQEAQPVKNSQ